MKKNILFAVLCLGTHSLLYVQGELGPVILPSPDQTSHFSETSEQEIPTIPRDIALREQIAKAQARAQMIAKTLAEAEKGS